MIRSPVLILGCPRSGTTLLFNILSEVPSLWSIGYESKAIIERYHHPRVKNWESGALDEGDLTPISRDYMLAAFEREAASGVFWRRVNRFRDWLRGNPVWTRIKQRGRTEAVGSRTSSALPQQGMNVVRFYVRARNRVRALSGPRTDPIRLLEKTPENCLRLPFLVSLFPDARILYLTRDGRSNVNSLIEGWKQPHLFPGYRVPEALQIPGYTRKRWAFSLIPGWRDLCASSLEEVCAWQWIRCNEAVLAHREETRGEVPYLTIRYEDLVGMTQTMGEGQVGGNTTRVLRSVADFLEIDFERDLARAAQELPQINVVSAPGRQKWRRQNADAITRITPLIEPMMQRLGYDSSDW
jgi:hypothetical protein